MTFIYCSGNSAVVQFIRRKNLNGCNCPVQVFGYRGQYLLVIDVPDLFPQVDAGAVDLFGVDREIGVFVADFTQSYL